MPYSQARGSRRTNSRPSFSSNRGGGGGGGYRGGGSRGGGNRNRGKSIDPRMFVKKARPVEEVVYDTTNQFADFGFGPELSKNLEGLGYITPTPIQDQAIPHAMTGRDVLGIANTGTGKTAAFLLPLIEHVLANPKTATVLIIAPVRELAQQIEAELAGFVKGTRIGYMSAIGGTPIGPQLRKLDQTPHFIIGTPGRITDLIERRAIPLRHISAVVLDEVDRMLDMGFVDDVRAILQAMPEEKQSLFFSATMSPEVSRLIDTFMNDHITISVKTQETSDNVEQDIVRVGYGMEKMDLLHDLLLKPEIEKVLVFGETKFGVERLAKELSTRGFKADAIHGNKSQGQRSRTIEGFKRGDYSILVATDVAARGLDIKGITHVINYDLPQTYEDYTHRIGRTGRAGKMGYSLTFVG
ncbi:MAG: putative box helicase domain protein [Candidatus Saccharibacteria bacterium]|nr:putative box helicase domain protein [Candidatus Saccharibacteria bacterium]